MWRWVVGFVLIFGGVAGVKGQECPRNDVSGQLVDSAPRQLHGLVVLHEGIRIWLELKPDHAVCGQTSVQLLPKDVSTPDGEIEETHALERMRGCRVTLTGPLGLPGTGYYSAPIYMTVEKRQTDPDCKPQPALPDYSKARPERSIRTYRVHMLINYGSDGGVRAVIRSQDTVLRPWQAYANYHLTGLFVFYGRCADGFSMSKVRGTMAAHPGRMDDVAVLDPETAAKRGVSKLYLDFTCSR